MDIIRSTTNPDRIVEPITSSNKTNDDPNRNNDGDQYIPSMSRDFNVGLYKGKPESIVNRENVSENPLDKQVGGSHYKRFKIQPIEFCQANKLDACQSAVIKYICRHEFKNGLQDLEKAKHYIDLLIQLEYGDVTNQRVQTE